ncbi:MAG: PD40 domain-containing protein [Planctomycetes bacterium]|nr:PD40 domain-containing protein [Planctomycetota bacterium]
MIEKYWKADSKLRDKIKSEIEKFSKLIKEASTDKNPELNMRANRIRQSLYSLCHPKIAFDSNRDGNSDIYTMDADGKNQTRLTDSPKNDISPRWSPDGKKIAFVSERDGNSEIYVMDADGKNQTRLTNNPKSDSSPDWSPIFLPELSALFAEEEKK